MHSEFYLLFINVILLRTNELLKHKLILYCTLSVILILCLTISGIHKRYVLDSDINLSPALHLAK